MSDHYERDFEVNELSDSQSSTRFKLPDSLLGNHLESDFNRSSNKDNEIKSPLSSELMTKISKMFEEKLTSVQTNMMSVLMDEILNRYRKISSKIVDLHNDESRHYKRLLYMLNPEMVMSDPNLQDGLYESDYINIVKENPELVKLVRSPFDTKRVYEAALSADGMLLEYVVSHYHDAIEDSMIRAALIQNINAIEYVPQQFLSDENPLPIIVDVINKDPELIQHVHKPGKVLRDIVLSKCPSSEYIINNPDLTLEDYHKAIEVDPDCILQLNDPDYSLIREAVRRKGNLIRNICRHNEKYYYYTDLWFTAVEQDREMIRYMLFEPKLEPVWKYAIRECTNDNYYHFLIRKLIASNYDMSKDGPYEMYVEMIIMYSNEVNIHSLNDYIKCFSFPFRTRRRLKKLIKQRKREYKHACDIDL